MQKELGGGVGVEKKKWNRVLPVLLVMVTAILLLSGCGGKSDKKEDAETITVYLWSTSLYEKYYFGQNRRKSATQSYRTCKMVASCKKRMYTVYFRWCFLYNLLIRNY